MSGMPGMGPIQTGSYPVPESDEIEVVISVRPDVGSNPRYFTVTTQKIAVRDNKLVKVGAPRQQRIEFPGLLQ